MRCSLNVIPQTKDLLNKSRLPLGILIHPFKDLEVWAWLDPLTLRTSHFSLESQRHSRHEDSSLRWLQKLHQSVRHLHGQHTLALQRLRSSQ